MVRGALVVVLPGLVACAEPTLEEFCDLTFECFAFEDSAECQQVWLDPNEPDTSCADEPAYLECAIPCADEGCSVALDDCEESCWTQHCEG